MLKSFFPFLSSRKGPGSVLLSQVCRIDLEGITIVMGMVVIVTQDSSTAF